MSENPFLHLVGKTKKGHSKGVRKSTKGTHRSKGDSFEATMSKVLDMIDKRNGKIPEKEFASMQKVFMTQPEMKANVDFELGPFRFYRSGDSCWAIFLGDTDSDYHPYDPNEDENTVYGIVRKNVTKFEKVPIDRADFDMAKNIYDERLKITQPFYATKQTNSNAIKYTTLVTKYKEYQKSLPEFVSKYGHTSPIVEGLRDAMSELAKAIDEMNGNMKPDDDMYKFFMSNQRNIFTPQADTSRMSRLEAMLDALKAKGDIDGKGGDGKKSDGKKGGGGS